EGRRRQSPTPAPSGFVEHVPKRGCARVPPALSCGQTHATLGETPVHDLIIRGGTIVDGTGKEPFVGDIAIDADKIGAVGKVEGPARRVIDATGHVVTPGWVDIHTHYDGQATWDPLMAPSSWHGVTTAIMGNCGVGFAPVKPDAHDFLIELMEGVEDIP